MLVGPSKEKKNKRNEMALAIRLVAEMKNMTIRKPQRVKADVCIFATRGSKKNCDYIVSKQVFYSPICHCLNKKRPASNSHHWASHYTLVKLRRKEY